jgi:hypothetical protein
MNEKKWESGGTEFLLDKKYSKKKKSFTLHFVVITKCSIVSHLVISNQLHINIICWYD